MLEIFTKQSCCPYNLELNDTVFIIPYSNRIICFSTHIQINGRLFDTIKTGGDSGVSAYKKPQSIIWGSIF